MPASAKKLLVIARAAADDNAGAGGSSREVRDREFAGIQSELRQFPRLLDRLEESRAQCGIRFERDLAEKTIVVQKELGGQDALGNTPRKGSSGCNFCQVANCVCAASTFSS